MTTDPTRQDETGPRCENCQHLFEDHKLNDVGLCSTCAEIGGELEPAGILGNVPTEVCPYCKIDAARVRRLEDDIQKLHEQVSEHVRRRIHLSREKHGE